MTTQSLISNRLSELFERTRSRSQWFLILRSACDLSFVAVLFLSSMYCLLAYIPTTYFAFIQAPFLAWMPIFARLQPYLFTITFCGAAIPLWERFRSGHDRRLILEFWFIGILGSACLLWMRPVQSLGNNSLSFVWAIAFLLPVICLGALDYAGYLGKLKEEQGASRPFSYVRVVAAALLVSVLYPGSAFLRFYIARMPSPLTRNELAICVWAAITQVLLFLFVASIVELARRAADRSAHPEATRFLLFTGLWWLGLAFSMFKVVLASIPFAGTEGAVYACSLSMAAVIFIGGRRLRRRVQKNHAAAAVEQEPDKQHANGYESAALFLLIFAAALIVPLFIGSMDWHSILEKTWAMVLWVMAAALVIYRQPLARGRLRTWHILLVAFISLAVFRAGLWSQKSWAAILSGPNPDAGMAIRQHETFDASFAAANEIMTPASSRQCDQDCRFISNQTNIPASARVDLHNVSLVHNLQPNHGSKPNIFIIVVDSLRRDYLSPYNSSVDFTPAIGAFAQDSIVFRNSFTRYSGTTLSEPSIWAGMLMLHKHYVQPFHLVNNLEKMIQADDYQSMVSVDTVLRVVLQPAPDLVQLDTDEAKWTDQDFCSTSAEVAGRIAQRKDHNRPIFLYTQPQNVHFVTLSKTVLLRPPKKHYGSFVDFYASELERLDGCFGKFIGALKAQGLYDNSIIVLTADHGENLDAMGGERHAFSLKPEVIQVPLIMHVPPAIRKSWYYDQDLIAFNTDITATLHELLGHGPVIARPEFGRPLITPNSDEMQKYKQDSYLIASSYGFVYGLLFDNGKKLFVDTQGEREFFDLDQDPAASHNVLTQKTRVQNEAILKTDIQGISDLYGYKYIQPNILDWLTR